MIKKPTLLSLAIMLAISSVAIFGTPVLARDGSTAPTTTTDPGKKVEPTTPPTTGTGDFSTHVTSSDLGKTGNPTTTGQADTGKLTMDKQKICENHQGSITEHMTNILARANAHVAIFAKVATRAEAFATAHTKPSNYDALVADVTAKQAAVTAAIATLTTDSKNFSCTSADPKGDVTQFKTDLTAVIAALKAEQTSIKTLIAAIKAAQPAPTTSTTTTTGGSSQ